MTDGILKLQLSDLRANQFHFRDVAAREAAGIDSHDLLKGSKVLPRKGQIRLGLQYVDEGTLNVKDQRPGGIEKLKL